jgi:hypothetical protein
MIASHTDRFAPHQFSERPQIPHQFSRLFVQLGGPMIVPWPYPRALWLEPLFTVTTQVIAEGSSPERALRSASSGMRYPVAASWRIIFVSRY